MWIHPRERRRKNEERSGRTGQFESKVAKMEKSVEFFKNINNKLQQKFPERHIDMSYGGLYDKTPACLEMTATSMQTHLKAFSDAGDELSMYALTNE